MDTTDRAAEWRRLKEVYAQMSEDELAVIADEGYQLTDLAKQALETEIANRRLDLKLKSAPPDPEEIGNVPSDGEDDDDDRVRGFDPDELGLVPVRRVWDLEEARIAKTILDGIGIPSYLGDDNVGKVDEYTVGFDGGVDLKVRAADATWAVNAIANRWPAPSPEEMASLEYFVKCPKCRSTEVVFLGRDGEQTGNAAFNAKYKWNCDACGHNWEDDGVEQS